MQIRIINSPIIFAKVGWVHNRCAIGATFGRFWGPFSTSKKKHCFENCFASFWKIVFPKSAFWDPKFENCFAKLFCKIVLNNFPKKLKKCFAGLMFFRENLKNCFFTKNDHFKKLKNTFLPNNACTWGVLTSLLNNDRGIITPVKSCKPGYSVAVAGLRWLSRNSAVPKT